MEGENIETDYWLSENGTIGYRVDTAKHLAISNNIRRHALCAMLVTSYGRLLHYLELMCMRTYVCLCVYVCACHVCLSCCICHMQCSVRNYKVLYMSKCVCGGGRLYIVCFSY